MSDEVVVQVPDGATAPAVLVDLFVTQGQIVDAGQSLACIVVDKADVVLVAPAAGQVLRTARAGSTLAAGDVVVALGPGSGAMRPSPDTPSPSGPVPLASRVPERTRIEPLSRRRRIIAQTMVNSLTTSAQATTLIPVDVTGLQAGRARHNPVLQARLGLKVSPFHLLARAVCLNLREHPILNTWVSDDARESVFHDYVDLGVAVDAPGGLVVVNVSDAGELPVVDIARRVQELAAKARGGSLRAEDVRRGTFTMSNTGSNGTTAGTPILNPPQVALLATYAIERRVVVRESAGVEGMAVRSMMNLALTYDHRIIDGADAGRFMSDLRRTIESTLLEDELADAARAAG